MEAGHKKQTLESPFRKAAASDSLAPYLGFRRFAKGLTNGKGMYKM